MPEDNIVGICGARSHLDWEEITPANGCKLQTTSEFGDHSLLTRLGYNPLAKFEIYLNSLNKYHSAVLREYT